MSKDFDDFLRTVTPFRWDAVCPKCRNSEFVTSTHDHQPENSVCDRCDNGIMRWKKHA